MFYNTLYYFIILAFRWFFILFYKREIKGLENIPLKGGLIIACNHVSNFDPPFVGGICEKRRANIYFAKKEITQWPLIGWVFRGPKFIAVDRRRPGGDLGAIKAALKLVKKGGSLFIFPEGTRSKTGKPGRAKAGIGFLVQHSGVPVVPIRIQNTDKLPFTRKVMKMTVGKPFTIEPDATRDAKEQLQEFADKVMQEINKLD